MQTAKLLIIDDNEKLLGTLRRVLSKDFVVVTASNVADAKEALGEVPDIVLLDIRLDEQDENDRSGILLLQEFLAAHPALPLIMFSGFNDIETAVECMRLGASDFIHKSAGVSELRQRLKTALAHARLSRRVMHLEEHLERLEPSELIGQSPQIADIKRLIQMVAHDGYVNVLIRGDTGTGKELVARAIHRVGWRSKEPFVPVAIASLNPNLVESEMFGHEPGAFTGARERRVGFIEKAKRGVLFLDEVGDLPLDAQLKLLRFLEDRHFTRVGSSSEVEVSVQIVAATNRDMEEAVRSGRVREDLYFRLKSAQIFLPPLRRRPEDILPLVNHFLKLLREQGRTRISEVSPEVIECFMRYGWPGNARELKTVLECTVIYANFNEHTIIEKQDLPLDLLNEPATGVPQEVTRRFAGGGFNLDEELARLELSYIEKALQYTEERKTEAWKLLGLNDRFALLRRVKTVLKTYPNLGPDFPTVRRLYGKDTT